MSLAQIRHIDQYFGAWAMDGDRFMSIFRAVRGGLSLHLQQVNVNAGIGPMDDGEDAIDPPDPYDMIGSVAVIQQRGMMLKYGSSMSDGTPTLLTRRAVNLAAADSNVASIMLVIDSPGGSCSGTGDLADAISAAAKIKPVCAFIEDLGCSAAYWIASQATRIVANRHAFVGSIGVYAVVEDSSRAYDNAGIKAHLITTGKNKGAGADGVPITDEQLAEWQSEVNSINSIFLASVLAGRKGMTAAKLNEIADGRVFLAAEALSLGLIDQIGTFDDALSSLTPTTARPSTARAAARRIPMSEANPIEAVAPAAEPKPLATAATLAELKAACPGADPAFLLGCLEKQQSVAQSQAGLIDLLNARLAAQGDQLKAAIAERDKHAAHIKRIQESGSASAIPFAEGGQTPEQPNPETDPEAAWKADAKLRDEFGDNYQAFVAFNKNSGRVNIRQ